MDASVMMLQPGSAAELTKEDRQRAEVAALLTVEWDFAEDAPTRYTHGFHPYPARFIADIPASVLDRLATRRSIVLDPFVGSGTTLVETAARGLRGFGVDVNPLAALVARVKATVVAPDLDQINQVKRQASAQAARFYTAGNYPLDYVRVADELAGARFSGVDFWFSREAQMELSALRSAIDGLCGLFRDQCLAALSAIVVRASRQDSDTRYVRREKRFAPLACVGWWEQRMLTLRNGIVQMAEDERPKPTVFVADSRDIEALPLPAFDLVVTSSPYPNAFTYSLYHQLRAIWVGVPVDGLRKDEIGNHRDYSRKKGSDRETFLADMVAVLRGLRAKAAPEATLVFVIGDSIVRGQPINNTALLRQAAESAGVTWVGDVKRSIRTTRKSFNPAIGKIRTESVCVMST